ncbi:MAG TPA: nucleoside triphosphatase YtkD [Bacillus bacterium]|nr:nucleoside triphosphatase YtkD [Bacillus sp. (in: firmicutes)]
MLKFKDYYENEVRLSFAYLPFSKTPKHVWVICKYEDKWLLTVHKERGIEFPGGKVEIGESPEEAAHREVLEETGGTIKNLSYIGQYAVFASSETIIKNIYFAQIERLHSKDTFFETDGPIVLEELPNNIFCDEKFSFIMKDQVLQESLKQIEKIEGWV